MKLNDLHVSGNLGSYKLDLLAVTAYDTYASVSPLVKFCLKKYFLTLGFNV